MRRTALLIALLVLLGGLSACSSVKNIYPDNPWEASPGLKTIAVAPFLIKAEIAQAAGQPFNSYMFQTSDGFMAHFSRDFAQEFANGLTNFKGLTIVDPDRVLRAWQEAVDNKEMTNPLATREDALKIAARLKADAILVGEVVEWNPFDTRITLNWSLHATRNSAIRATDIRTIENAGRGGLLEREQDRSAMPVYAEQLTLDKESIYTKQKLEEYVVGLSEDDVGGYSNLPLSVTARPFPRFVRFTAWVAMTNAFAGTTTSEKPRETAASGE